MTIRWLQPDWPVPAVVRAASTVRSGGVSTGHYVSLNLAAHVGDDPTRVATNRARLRAALSLPEEPAWLQQTHGCDWVGIDQPGPRRADAAIARRPGAVCAVLTADCLPVLLSAKDGSVVAAVHAGWRGLAAGVVETTVNAMATADLLAWLGPAIGPDAFQVGPEVRETFLTKGRAYAAGFRRGSSDRWWADLYRLARIALNHCGVDAIYGGDWCTYHAARDFFSFRRDRVTGRMATLIWIDPRATA